MSTVALCPKDHGTAMAALRVAAEAYCNDAKRMRGEGQHRLAEQFERQAKDAMQLAAYIEEAK